MEGALPKNPNLDIPQFVFSYSRSSDEAEKASLKDAIVKATVADKMAPYYRTVCAQFGWVIDNDLVTQLETENETEIKRLDTQFEDAKENAGETEQREALLAKAEYIMKIGDKEKAVTAFRVVYDKTASLGYRLDIIFSLIRVGFFFSDLDLITRNIEKGKSLVIEGGDWDRRNRLKVYEGIHLMSIRNFKEAAVLFNETLSTFISTELMEFKDFVKYTVLTAAFVLERPDLKKKIIESSEVLEVVQEMPLLGTYVGSLYNCNYAAFFTSLAQVEQLLKNDYYLNLHYRFYTREMRIKAYSQLLESYRSLSISSMAQSFGVSVEWLDRDIARFISAGRLHCVIDKVGGVVETNRPDSKSAMYAQVIKQGDLLLNRVQKLSRVITV